ncbi:MAG: Gfo/Idh/MocA family oxidoreductase [Phycisphaeraceae bacterium]|nr:Gfo/Idh/MocA family oxidoreductase [Phycisphaeraceae bacterium]
MGQSNKNEIKPVAVAVVGAGRRGLCYAAYAKEHPDRMSIVAVAEPNADRRAAFGARHQIPLQRQFTSYQNMLASGKAADAAINCTMDAMHYDSTAALLKAGYHILLEKPIARSASDVRKLIGLAQQQHRIVMICHVLRYVPFYLRIKELLDSGAIGRIVAIRSAERVSYHHMAVGFVRGRWNKAETSNPILLARCCHDLDLIAWFKTGHKVTHVASFGELTQFRPENAPTGATDRCLDCPHVETCRYSAKKHYVDMGLWLDYAFESHQGDPSKLTEDRKILSLKDPNNPYGRCVWKCDNDVVDHQTVIARFADGVTATHDLFTATARPTRTLHILGELGELQGDFEAGHITLRKPQLKPGAAFSEERILLHPTTTGHVAGDLQLVHDFVSLLRGEPTSASHTRIEDSLTGHLIAYAADLAMKELRTVMVDDI